MDHKQKKALHVAEMIAGLAIGLQILVKAADKAEHFAEAPVKIVVLFLLGLFVIVGSVGHRRLEKRVRNAHALFHILEGAALVVSAVILFEKGRMRLPLMLLILGLLFGAVGAVAFRITPENWKSRSRLLMHGIGLAALAGGAALAGFTMANDRDPWAMGCGALTMGVGCLALFHADGFLARMGKKYPGPVPEAQPDPEEVPGPGPQASNGG
ncbi:MAG: hypothetical protein KA419_06745 [Acidobacteria bacterium]|nr:hypothetical protein [Acidobacteriota bacterium]